MITNAFKVSVYKHQKNTFIFDNLSMISVKQGLSEGSNAQQFFMISMS